MANKKDKVEEATVVEEATAAASVKVPVKIPYIDGEDPEVTVGINGKFTKIKRGATVMVDPEVAEVLENSDLQMMTAREFQKEYEGKGKEFDF